jgi:N-acetylmuramoyl-L-alanine amidase
MDRLIKFLAVVSLLLLPLGCATAPTTVEIPIQTYNLNGTTYVPLKGLCDNLGIGWQWDDVTQTAVISKGDHQAKILVDSQLVYLDGRFEKINPPPKNYRGIIVVPWKLKEQIIRQLLKPAVSGEAVFAKGYQIKKITIDAGHGGKDPGAIGRGGIREKELVLDVAQRLRDELRAKGFAVVMTRDSDEFISLARRSEIANRAKADLFVSIHANANRSRWIRGFEVYHPRSKAEELIPELLSDRDSSRILDGLKIDKNSRNTEGIVLDLIYTQNQADAVGLAKCIASSAGRNLEVSERGIRAASFYVLRNTRIPAILVEIGYITNANEAKYLRSGSYRQDVVDAIAKGIINYGQQCLVRRVGR